VRRDGGWLSSSRSTSCPRAFARLQEIEDPTAMGSDEDIEPNIAQM